MNTGLVPIGRIAATDIREVTTPGLFFPLRASEPIMFLTGEAGGKLALKLNTDDAFNQFPISLKTPCQGMFVPDVEIRVDVTTAMDATGLTDKRGNLILTDNEVQLVVGRVGDEWTDPAPFGLSIKVPAGSDAVRIAFKSWAIGIVHEDEFLTLWKSDAGE
jgi:hypothetical protein